MTLPGDRMPAGRRSALGLRSPPAEANAALWMGRYMPEDSDDKDGPRAKARLVQEVAGLHAGRATDVYRAAYARWHGAMQRSGAALATLHTVTPVIVGLSGESLLETNLTLDHTYGVPVLPGTALKGLAAQYAHVHLQEDEWRVQGEWHRRAFGTVPADAGGGDAATGETGSELFTRGEVTFHTALPRPGEFRLRAEVLTVHHPEYYGGQDKPPADWDSPIPVSFLSAMGDFTLALHCEDTELGQAVFALLKLALERARLGAKTSSGYGQFHVQGDPFAPPEPPAALAEALKNIRFLKRNDVVRRSPDLANRFARLLEALAQPEAQSFREAAIHEALTQVRSFATDRDTWRDVRKSAWYKTLAETYGVPEL
ncbi:type III-B CRISPR module RAMP protein Cmr6 [Deinococcus marmoris]|uniref:type III-B CRISPR module RAMP protein Cmr6 n=1 Tax=Deinococcus marmoris TaxID=249408 RepID=UPI00068BA155|nr:type III-B CRISPR module RAMP protein Cmr6 [Deinococcus marmoris]